MSAFAVRYRAFITGVMLIIALSVAYAGGGPQNVLIVENANSTESLEIANAYRRARNIPYSHVVTLNTTNAFQISYQDYLDEIETPIRTHLTNHQLTDEITSIVLTRGVPQMVTEDNGRSVASLLAAMGIPRQKQGYARLSNPYYNAPDAFSHQPSELKGMYLVTVLNGYHNADIQRLIANGVAADGTGASGRYILQVVPQTYLSAVSIFKMLAIRNIKSEIYTTLPQNRSGLMGYFANGPYSGVTRDNFTSFEFKPGALVDLAQNFSAAPNNFEQTAPPVMAPISWFVQAGATGIDGVVGATGANSTAFRCAPDQLLGKYTSGFSLAESFYASLPFVNWQNIIIGDPLCSPYVQRPIVNVEMPEKPAKGFVPVRVTASSPASGTTISRVDVYVDDDFAQTIYQPDRTRIALYIGEEIVNYTVPHGATLRTLLNGLADAVNNDPILSAPDGVRAVPALDNSTLMLIARKSGADNNEIPIGIDVETDTNTPPCVMARVEGGWMAGGGQDPRPASAVLSFMGRLINAGDEIQLQIQQEHFSFTVPAHATIADLPAALADLINNNTTLKEKDGVVASCADAGMPYLVLQARTPGEHGNAIAFQVTVKPVDDSQLHVFPNYRAQLSGGYDGSASIQTVHFMLGDVSVKSTYLLNTAELADGYHQLRIVAYDGSLAQAQGVRVIPFAVSNLDTPPTISLPEKLDPANSSVTIPITASSSVAKVEVFVDGQLLASSTTAPYNIRIPLTSLGRGQHDLWAEASDVDGHSFITAPMPLQVLTPPEVTRITPNFTAIGGGTVHQIIGSGFQPDSQIRLAGVPVRTMKYLSPNLLEVTCDAGPARQGWVEVANPDGTVSQPTIGFEYYQPRVDQIQVSPSREVLMPGTKVQFTATCFDQHNFPIVADINWESNAGNISAKGSFTAGNKFGTFTVRASLPNGKEVGEVPVTIGPAPINNGRLQHWLVLGAFPDPDYTALEASQIQEVETMPAHGLVVDSFCWRSLYADTGYIDFYNNMMPNTNALAYAHVYILAPTETSCTLVYGSDDGIRIWLNGELKQSLRVRRGCDPNQNTTPITLKPGWNRLLVKVDQGTGTWGFYMRIKANDGTTLPILKYSLDPPTIDTIQ